MSEAQLLHLPIVPDDDPVERSALGAMLLAGYAVDIGVEELTEEHFHLIRHQEIFTAMVEIASQGEAIDPVTVGQHLYPDNLVEAGGETCYLVELFGSVTTAHNMHSYVEILQERHTQHHTALRTMQMAQEAASGLHTPEELSVRFQDLWIREKPTKEVGFASMAEVMEEVTDAYDIAAESDREYTGLETEFYGLNNFLNGLCDSELTVVGARPGQGKTTLALQIALSVMEKEKCGVAFFSLEMNARQLGQRLACMKAGLDMKRLRRGRLTGSELLAFTQAMGQLHNLPLYIDDRSNLTPTQLLARARSLKNKHDIKLWIVDYLQLMEGSGEREDEQINSCSKALKQLSKDGDDAVLALAQLNREVERRADKRPQLADFRGSGGVEQDADNVLQIYQPGIYGLRDADGGPMDGQAELIGCKSRYSELNNVPLHWRTDVGMFANPAPAYIEEHPHLQSHWQN